MPWLKIDDRMWCNRKVNAVSAEAKAYWVWCMDYCADQLTDGFLQESELQMIAIAVGVSDITAVIVELVKANMFEKADGGRIHIHDYLTYNPSKEQVLREREQNTKRQERWQERHVNKEEPNGVNNAVTNMVPYPSPYPYPGPEPEPGPIKDIAPNGACVSDKKPARREKQGRTKTPEGFEEFWEAYPRKTARSVAVKAYAKCLSQGATQESVLVGAENYSQECQLAGREQQYICFPSTFLNQQRFQDHQRPPDPAEFAPTIRPRAGPPTIHDRNMAMIDGWKPPGLEAEP